MNEVHVLGVRHHGPGSARAVVAALGELQPDAVLIEGPADAGPLLQLAAAGMVPPVALLAYAVDNPAHSAFWPFAVFSPEWQALSWALQHGVTVRFCDLPAAMVLAGGAGGKRTARGREPGDGRPGGAEPAGEEPEAELEFDLGDGEAGEDGEPFDSGRRVRADPLAMLSAAAGYDDPERWWDDVIEHRVAGAGAEGPFEAITEAMTELRRTTVSERAAEQLREDRREAYMRTQVRAVQAEGAQRVVVVCGAWHAPALTGSLFAGPDRPGKPTAAGKLPSAAADARVLRGTPKRKVALTWVPWTHSRLSAASGYGAGITSPGWYHHLFSQPELTVTRWLTRVARVLRTEDLPVSSAGVIEAVRLAEALAGLRGRQRAGLDEVTEATRSVLVDGDDVALALVTSRLVVGEALGEVPDGTPTVPLEADLRAQARRLRLKLEPAAVTLDLDLRKPYDLSRSHLLHRLGLLELGWAQPAESAVQSTGTFRETWRLSWQPEFSVAVIQAAMWGSTVEAAARARLRDRAEAPGTTLPQLTAALEACLLADLTVALPGLLAALDDRAAVDLDLEHLTEALPALVRALRYGDVRGTDTGALGQVAGAVLTRICVGLPQAVTSLDDVGSAKLRSGLDAVHAAVSLLDPDPAGPARQRWLAALAAVIDRPDVNGLLVGRMVRILRDVGRLDPGEAALRLGRALSVGTTAAAKAAWVEGFFSGGSGGSGGPGSSGGGLLLVHDRDLLGLLDDWIVVLDEPDFVDVLPLLRRTFGQFEAGERRSIGEQVRTAGRPAVGAGAREHPLDRERAELAMSTVATLLGVGR